VISRRDFLKLSGAGILSLYTATRGKFSLRAQAAIPGGTLDPLSIPQFTTPLLIPPVMPKAGIVNQRGKSIDYYEISMRQFEQQILPSGKPKTTVWGYGAVKGRGGHPLEIHNAPSLTIEAQANRPVRIKWINDLKDANGNYLPHLLPVDPTLHWANPPGGSIHRDSRPDFTDKTYVSPADFTDPATQYTQYTGPVPMVSHVHGAVGVGDESDGYAEAWYLPAANNIPANYATEGTWYDFFAGKAAAAWGPGFATFQYPNDNRASTIWYHDHTLGMTRLNVYAGPAGFFIIRGGPAGDKAVLDKLTGLPAVLPGPAPIEADKFPSNKTYFEIPIAIQDRAFNSDGSLFYPDTRAFFDGIEPNEGQPFPYIPHTDVSPVWNPEFFGNMIMVNGNTWPFLNVQQRRYRFRFLNGCDSRFLILDFNDIPGVEVWLIGNEGGFLATPVNLTADNNNQLLMALAERADMIVDFTNVPVSNYELRNVGPDEPFGGGEFDPADPASTGKIMQFRVGPALAPDPTTPPANLVLPAITPLPPETVTRPVALIEEMSMYFDDAPAEALLGTIDGDPNVSPAIWTKRMWSEDVTEIVDVGTTEVWEIYNTTGDAHPMHIHEVVFEVVNRQDIFINEETQQVQVVLNSVPTLAEPWETGFKDTVTAYPGQVTRVRAQFNKAGQFTWHCHIVSHEDNEMMRPYRIGPVQPGQPGSIAPM
jgi:spore coat protein A, manganese oxidase